MLVGVCGLVAARFCGHMVRRGLVIASWFEQAEAEVSTPHLRSTNGECAPYYLLSVLTHSDFTSHSFDGARRNI
eukprot:1161875-Pelagomonas_calceolata.AAC.15